MKKVILVLFIALSTGLNSQSIEIPANVQLNSKEDYKKQEALVLKAIDWIQNTNLDKDIEKRKDVNAFLMKWMMGSPSVSIELIGGVVPLDCKECLMSFLAGWTKYSLENDYSKNKIEGALSGTNRMIDFYQKNEKFLENSTDIKKLIKKKKKKKLRKYLESKF